MNEDSERAQRTYQRLGPDYSVRTSLNAWAQGPFEGPALLALLGDVSGKRVLDASCAGGRLSEQLLERGAAIVALDLTEAMTRAARERLGARAGVLRADLAQGLPLRTAAIDAVASGFTLHYLRDWSTPLREFRRVLKPGGALVLSTHHPATDLRGEPGYFETKLIEDTWQTTAGEPATVRFYHRPLEAIFEALATAGFHVERLLERQPGWPDEGEPWFLCLRCRPA
jgi:ubiquinone/menaquinone biosynthesis C-methylase UbiE